MIGKEPEIFMGDRDKVEEFMTSWSVYQGINKQTRVMNNPMSRTMLFFGYLRGPKMHLLLRYCRNVRPTWVKFDSKDTKESE